VTLVGEADRKMLKAAIKHAAAEDQVRPSHCSPRSSLKWVKALQNLRSEIAAVLQDEKEEKKLVNAISMHRVVSNPIV